MLSKAKIKFVKSLQIKKYRKQEQCFVVEGAKSVQELLNSDFEVVMLVATKAFLDTVQFSFIKDVIVVMPGDLAGIGEFQTNDTALAVARMKENTPLDIGQGEFALVLDDIRDPGNFGTIIRTSDWFGIRKIIASEGTADVYNQKVITSTMGSFTRVSIFYTNLETYLAGIGNPIFGAYLDGTDVHHTNFGDCGFILIGNESRGISDKLTPVVTHKITIPRYGQAESLNAAIATAIICDNLRRKR